MRRTTSSKRSRSTSTQPESITDLARPVNAASNDKARDPAAAAQCEMPPFLQQSQADIQSKFQELVWMERNRIMQGTLDASPDHPWASAQGPHTRQLDRYVNIHPWKNNRVHLRVPEGKNDYINASPIVLKSSRTGKESKYIAMQGPKEGSASHVWRMIWDELASPAVIVMLTETHEAGQEKCFPYFPTDPEAEPFVINEMDEFGDGFRGTVRCEEVSHYPQSPAIVVRKMVMRVEGQEEEKVVWHLLFTRWPDFGILSEGDLEGFFSLMRLSKEKNCSPETPRIIHCSAGVGRSGTFIALEHLMEELEAGALSPEDNDDPTEFDPVFNTVNELREQRRTMVQAESQYHFIYAVLKERWEKKHAAGTRPDEKPSTREPASKVAKLGQMGDVHPQ